MQRNDLMCWMDLEMTSIEDARRDKITEIAVVLTDGNLNVVAEGPDIIIHVDPQLFEGISPSAQAVHDINGMRELSAASAVSAREAEEQVLAFLKEHCAPQSAPLCGNSIHADRHFLKLQMPELDTYLFYRCVDVSSIKELARRWAPAVYSEAERRKEEKPHRALQDVYASIAELNFYRGAFFTTL